MRFFPSLPMFFYRVLLCGALWFASRCGEAVLGNDSEKPVIISFLPLAMLFLSRGNGNAAGTPFWGWIPLVILSCVNLFSLVAIWRFTPCYELGTGGTVALTAGVVFFAAWGIRSALQRETGRVALCCLFLVAALPSAWSFAAMSSDDWASAH